MNIALLITAVAAVTFVLFATFSAGQRFPEEDRLDWLENQNRQRRTK